MTRQDFLERIDEIMCGTSNAERAYLADLYDEVTAPHWISVEDDGNPKDTGWYIFTTGKIVDVGYYLGGNEWRDVHPTHWMPMPQAPHHIIDANKKVDRIIGTADHIKTALDVLNKEGGDNENP